MKNEIKEIPVVSFKMDYKKSWEKAVSRIYDKDKEIEKLKKENKKLKQGYCKLNDYYYNMCIKNIEAALEIERLNYIIEDFEQWIEDSKREDFMALATINKIFFADELLNKLKELKGENDE